MKLLTALFFVSTLAGCALLEPFQDQAAEKVAEGVIEYCAQTDAAFRTDFRAKVNADTGGHTIQVECAE